MRFKRHVELEKGHLDIAPLIDVVFLLLIFFMLTSSFIFQPGIKIKLPKAVTSEVIQEKSVIVTVTGENVIYLNEEVVTVKELTSKLKKEASGQNPVLIKAARRTSMGRIVEVWDVCREVGISQINIATSQESR